MPHEHPHDHAAHAPIVASHAMTPYEKRASAIESLLLAKGFISAEAMRQKLEEIDAITPALGTRVVARAWVDPAFKAQLLVNAKEAIATLGIETDALTTLVALENTSTIHNVVVCTLCSCYPRALLGLPPDWYKSLNYRSRVVVGPRGVLREFGTDIPADVEVRVYDSTADMRYLVIPERPAGTEQLREAELAELVTRDSMIGVAKARTPVAV
ncbi:MAG: nitrile hydratase subunit alpha [Candidatus Tectomicrobia bacterium]|uniref:nitrile hydratase n=1 Tax=Tectimicrobiota bacterium TaxID=2528274 RepID=A0A937VYW7_UNCTE|nr:nitrile hydratase subunit alpha [Candidatus Tectomicrobia bacterium]